MRNIHVLPTENSSRLSYNKDGVLELHRLQWRKNNQHIYITNDEEIKEGDWVYSIWDKKIKRAIKDIKDALFLKKIILTTDQPSDSVQAIDDEFLEWFVKNPSCERVEVICEPKNFLDIKQGWEYEIIIPKEEPKLTNVCIKCGVDLYYADNFACQEHPKSCKGIYLSEETLKERALKEETKQDKIMERFIANAKQQETLEEVAEKEASLFYEKGSLDWNKYRQVFIVGAKWQQQQDKNKYSDEKEFYKYMAKQDSWKSVGLIIQEFIQLKLKEQDKKLYSEEEVIDILVEFSAEMENISNITKWFEQFKKK